METKEKAPPAQSAPAAAPVAQPLVIQQGGSGWVKPVVGGGILLAAVFFGKSLIGQVLKNKAEAQFDTPAGAIAQQFKVVFEKFPVVDAAYRRVALQMTPELKDDVYKLYRQATGGRSLSDDIAAHIKTGTQNTLVKQDKINNTPGTLIKITPDDKIQFLVQKGSQVRFAPGRTTAITLYGTAEGIAYDNMVQKPATTGIKVSLKPTTLQYTVNAVKEVPFEGYKMTEGFQKYFVPVVKTRKVFAMVRIGFPMMKDGKQQTIYLWADAREFVQGKTPSVKGLSSSLYQLLG